MRVARLWRKLDGEVECLVCERRCMLGPGKAGPCGGYLNLDGELFHTGYGVVSAVESRPIEIKPLFHYWPNSTALTFSGFGCNFYCPWCQNHHLSFSKPSSAHPKTPPERLVGEAVRQNDEGLCASFNEPAVLFDYLLDVFELGRRMGLYGTVVTNGYFTDDAVRKLVEAGADGFSVDIKGCPKSRRAIASIDHSKVFRNCRTIIDLGGHVEMVYLIVTGFNDDEECVDWILGKHLDTLGASTPLHINRYFPAHVWREPETPVIKLLEVRRKAIKMGIEYVYVGNVGYEGFEDTRCPRCNKLLISRRYCRVVYYRLDDGKCPRCGYNIPVRGRYVGEKLLTGSMAWF
ncbi:MAG: radical SAM protein [Candidatus Caldarchaeum sp.]